MHFLVSAALLFLSASSLAAQDFSGTYTGTYNGDPVVLKLSTTAANTYTGTINDSQMTYEVAAQSTGKNLKGTCTEKSLGLNLQLSGVLNGTSLSLNLSMMGAIITFDLKKVGAQVAVVAAPSQSIHSDARRDPAVVGRWTHQSNYNSGYGQGSMSSESVMIFYADGRLADGGSRTVTSGSDWSGSSSDQGSGVVEGVIWYTKGGQLYLQSVINGKTETQLLGKYYIEDGKMLITAQNGNKMLLYKD